ncbi:MAG: hemerythrin domain-containing protein, partial [Myxococcales bacterium]|nr:hemerythrin domain-containing protein [Myxococcales bacterium]
MSTDFTVRPFAFMRLTHEALRAGFADIRAAVHEGASVDAVRARYVDLARCIAVHAAQEDQMFFPILDARFDGAVRDADLRTAHAREDALQAAFEDALERADRDALRVAVDAWAPSFEAHLADEEAVMMPLTQTVADTPEGRAAVVRRIMEVDWEGMKRDQLGYVTASLAATKPLGPVRM